MNLIRKKAPSFKLKDQDGIIRSLSDYKGQMLLLYFYPKDMTPGCTIEAEVFRDLMKELIQEKVAVLGVSADSSARHKTFCDKHHLNFPLLSDEGKTVLQKYGVWVEKSMYGKKYMGIERESFLIDKNGIVVKHYEKVKPALHPQEVLNDVRAIKSRQ
ncbi:MAG: thioredoxin-dependent thiol peroxidase [Candidatus Yonathbacteria bacterium]|nr:thioredoxin-dependent thiol peroxidase [Candidatus Yonathbacteria bacterium]